MLDIINAVGVGEFLFMFAWAVVVGSVFFCVMGLIGSGIRKKRGE